MEQKMKLALTLTLTLTLSPRRGDPHFPRWNQSRTGKCSDALKSYSLSWGLIIAHIVFFVSGYDTVATLP